MRIKDLNANIKISFSANAMPKFVTIDVTIATHNKDEIDAYNKILFERYPKFKEMVEECMLAFFLF
jgi:hypothetical protein